MNRRVKLRSNLLVTWHPCRSVRYQQLNMLEFDTSSIRRMDGCGGQLQEELNWQHSLINQQKVDDAVP
jgi:hypothetical protein